MKFESDYGAQAREMMRVAMGDEPYTAKRVREYRKRVIRDICLAVTVGILAAVLLCVILVMVLSS